jgi:cellulose synthase (UDP-forming)
VKPFGHPFKVTPKGTTSKTSNYARGIFWPAATLIGLTIAGLIINTIPEWRIIDDPDALPIVAFWSAINSIVLFLVCMLSLQAPMRRGEERLELDEPIWLVSPIGTILTGRTKDLSLSGAGFELDRHGAFAARLGDTVRVFMAEVGFVAATVVRQTERFIGVAFALPASVERDLLIRKLFTVGLATTKIDASAWSSTGAMLKSIWDVRTEMTDQAEESAPGVVIDFPVEKLPARSLVVSPRPGTSRLSEIGAARRTFAA